MARQHTVVLVHGLFGFNHILWREYFKGVRSLLESMGMRVVAPQLPWAGDIESRSRKLAIALEPKKAPLHLIAHSMGGLDARSYITHLGGHSKVVSLTTLASPHRGSAAADYVCKHFSPMKVFAGVRSLTRQRIEAFNRCTPNHASVRYFSYGAWRPLCEQPWITRRYGRIIEQEEGKNDSQVSVASARWGEHIRNLQADHFELIGCNFWFNPFRKRKRFDTKPVYEEIALRILKEGFEDRS